AEVIVPASRPVAIAVREVRAHDPATGCAKSPDTQCACLSPPLFQTPHLYLVLAVQQHDLARQRQREKDVRARPRTGIRELHDEICVLADEELRRLERPLDHRSAAPSGMALA